jgi:hypothetical protein
VGLSRKRRGQHKQCSARVAAGMTGNAKRALAHTDAVRGAQHTTAASGASRGYAYSIGANDTRMRRAAWCSWCKRHCEHELKSRSSWGRSIHECTACSQRTLPCSRTGCKDFARGFRVPGPLGVLVPWHETTCILCQGLIDSWEAPDATRQEDGWCSWCFEVCIGCLCDWLAL